MSQVRQSKRVNTSSSQIISRSQHYELRQEEDGTYAGQVYGIPFSAIRKLEQAQAWVALCLKTRKSTGKA
jgi:hypothetical protein